MDTSAADMQIHQQICGYIGEGYIERGGMYSIGDRNVSGNMDVSEGRGMYPRADRDVLARGEECIRDEIGMYQRGDKDVSEAKGMYPKGDKDV